jgi:hypothetical protein
VVAVRPESGERMVEIFVWAAVGIGIACLAVAVIFWALILRRARRVGTKGFVQRSRLTCPKCHRDFDYDWVPGASLTSVRLGMSRYLACPLCRQWSIFNVYDTLVERAPATHVNSGPP